MDKPRTKTGWLYIGAFLIVIIVAAGLRFYRLPELPVGLHYDEAANGILAGEIAQGLARPIFIPAYTGKEVAFFYWTALCMRLLGVTPLALRLGAALIGIATVVATVWMVYELLYQEADAPWIALLSAGFLAVSFWHVVLSRYGFRAVGQPLFQALTVAALWRGLRSGKKGWLLAAGCLCGLTAYTYLAARLFPIPLGTALMVLLITSGDERQGRISQIALFASVAALVLVPLAYYWLTHPGSFLVRTRQVAASTWGEAWSGLLACLRMFILRGDPYIRFNIPYRPLFLPAAAILLIMGIGFAGWRFVELGRNSRRSSAALSLASYTLLLGSMPVMVLPSALATEEITPSNLRAVGLIPFVHVFPALGLFLVKSTLRRYLGRLKRRRLGWMDGRGCNLALVVLLLLVSTPVTGAAYFRDWAPSPELHRATDGDLVHVADYLNQQDLSSTTPYVASQHYRHPTVAFLSDDYDRIRWLVGGETLVFPSDEAGLVIFPRSASRYLEWAEALLTDDALIAAPLGPDHSPDFYAYRVDGGYHPDPERTRRADFGHIAQLLGYSVADPPRSGDQVELSVWLRVRGTPERQDYSPVVRLTDREGFIWGESHPFHYPSEQWLPGEVIVDRLSFPVSPGAPPGDYVVRFGLYSPGGDVRLPLLNAEGAYAGTYVELPIYLGRPEAPPRVEDLAITSWVNATMGGLTLLGSDFEAMTARPGERLFVTLFWQAEKASLPSHPVSLRLGDRYLYEGDPGHGTYPFDKWLQGEVVSDRYGPRVPLDTPPGDYPLEIQVGEMVVDLGRVMVEKTDRTFDVPAMAHKVGRRLGDQVELLGYDLSANSYAPGATLTLTLYWRALEPMSRDYTVFTHLVAPDGSMTGQRDNQPVGGSYPTGLWLPDEVVTDVYEIAVHPDAPEGEHRLETGMYLPDTGVRLPVEGGTDNAILLQKVTVAK